MKLARPLAASAALLSLCCTVLSRPREPLSLKAPDLSIPLVEVSPPVSSPEDPLKRAVFQRINRDRAAAGLRAVAWDSAVSRVADSFCARQVRERTRGHFLKDGIPPYARTGLAGVFGVQAENSVSWVTAGSSFSESPIRLAIEGHDEMMAEKPPKDGHRSTILDPEATHVGVGYALEHGRFQMAQEFLVRGLARLSLIRATGSRLGVRLEGLPMSSLHLRFVTIAREPLPSPLTTEEATARTSYSYPQAAVAYIPEGMGLLRVEGAETKEKIRTWPNREFSFNFVPDGPGLYTLVFYLAVRETERPQPGGSVTLWIEGA